MKHSDRTLEDVGPILRGDQGVIGWTGELEEVFTALTGALSELGRTPETAVLRFPPVMARRTFEASGFAESFPQLFGAVHSFSGDRSEHQALLRDMAEDADWGPSTRLTDYVLTPAACYPVYPFYTGTLPDEGVTADVLGFCFRHEPSDEPGRLVSFRQREFVRMAGPEAASEWFERWRERALRFLRRLGLDPRLEVANDPFFGHGGRLLAASQREQNLKFELIALIDGHPSAVASCNLHRDHFGEAFGIRAAEGGPAHTTCVGFGMERLVLALVSAHGTSVRDWPRPVREALWR